MPRGLTRYDELGHTHFWTISCYHRLSFFWDDTMKGVAVAGLRHIQYKYHICLIAYGIMPEHVHVLLYPHPPAHDVPVPVSDLLRDYKQQYVGFHGKECLRAYWRDHGRLWSDPLNRWARGEMREQRLWNPRVHDRNILQRGTLIEKLDYCHKNPITRGLVDNAEDWVWSSYRFYESDDRSMIAMNWDGRWPIIW